MAVIEGAAVTVSHRRLLAKGARRLADDALAECLERAHLDATDLDLLINAGIYREKNLAEPALASMIQEDIGANPGHPTDQHAHGTFSFDVANAGAGVVTALDVVAGLMASNVIKVGAVVTSDSNPGNVDGFPFPNVGGAIVLRPSPPGTGFLAFGAETFPEFGGAFESVIAWHEREHPVPLLPDGRNILEIRIREDYAEKALECATGAVRRFLAAHSLSPTDIDLLVASAYPRAFAADLARSVELLPECVSAPDARFEEAHTAGIIASLDAAIQSRRLFRANNALFVAVGAGITVATALYRHPRDSG